MRSDWCHRSSPVVLAIKVDFSKYDRQERITWWDQRKLLASRVLIAGAGALGNEIVKNLALVGVGNIHIVDMDRIENTNLTRCAFFRESDEGKYKSEVLAHAAGSVNRDVNLTFDTCMVQELGDAYLRSFDLVISALDNREARIWLSASARRHGITMVDGAIEGLMGKVQIFTPTSPCYACTLTEQDWQMISKRKACSLLEIEEIIQGHTPTNATTSSIIAGVQSQEIVKLLTGNDQLVQIKGKSWLWVGESMASLTSQLVEDPDCPYHSEVSEPERIPAFPQRLTEILERYQSPTLYLLEDLILVRSCKGCADQPLLGFAFSLTKKVKCHTCGEVKETEIFNAIEAGMDVASLPLHEVDWPREMTAFVQHAGGVTSVIIGREA